MKSHSGEQVNLLGSCFPVKGMSYERMLYAVRCLKSNEDMILALVFHVKSENILSSSKLSMQNSCCCFSQPYVPDIILTEGVEGLEAE